MNFDLLKKLDDYRDNLVEEFYVGSFNEECQFCGALRLPRESKYICCSGGKVRLTMKKDMPESFRALLWNNQEVRKNARAYNQALSFTSVRTKVDNTVLNGRGIYNYRISGELYHAYGDLNANVGPEEAEFAQIYIHDPNEQMRRRLAIFEGLDEEALQVLQDVQHERNPYVQLFQQVGQTVRHNVEEYQVNLHHLGGVNSTSSANEVGSILLDGSNGNPRDIILRTATNDIHRMNELHSTYDPLQYPLLFPNGDSGWHDNIALVRNANGIHKRVTMRQYYAYHMMLRHENLHTNPLHLGGRLFQQYLVDMWSKVESNRLNYIARNQQQMRSDKYRSIQDAVANGDDITGKRILPSSFTGGPRYMAGKYQDAMAVVRKEGKPHLFMTMTCNPMWPEIQENLLPGQCATDRPDLIARVFKAKLDQLVNVELPKLFGRINAKFYSVEFQKRGLPHAHILVILGNVRISDLKDLVSAEIPSEDQPVLRELVLRHMIHKPCNEFPNASCKDCRGNCTKRYPKAYREESSQDENGYPLYRRRRNTGNEAVKYFNGRPCTITNANVVPYVPYLLQRLNCHINVEICSSVCAVKYLFKYIYKGSDRGTISVENGEDEIKKYKAGRYISPVEAAYRLLEFNLHYQSHTVHRLPVHLPEQQVVQFDDGDDLQEVIERSQTTKLTEFFKVCRVHRNLRYIDVVNHFVWKRGTWVPRQREPRKCLARMYAVSPMEGERFYLRMLLNVVRGPRGFEDIKTYQGHIYSTFKAAAVARGLLSNDEQYNTMMREAASHEMPEALRHTFAAMLLFSEISDPVALWSRFLVDMSYDIRQQFPTAAWNDIAGMVAYKINEVLELSGSSIQKFIPDVDLVEDLREENEEDVEQNLVNVASFTQEQLRIYEEVMEAIEGQNGRNLIFVQAPGGCGKTYFYNGIAAQLITNGRNVYSVAASAIASSLLIRGNTAHAFFKIPLNASDSSTCNIAFNTRLAQTIREADCFIWDEAPMSDKYTIEAVDKTLRDLLQIDAPFGGKTFLFGGDFRQTLPVIPGGSRAEIVDACLKRSYLWRHIHVMHLRRNLRASDEQWCETLLEIGEGTYPANELNEIEVPPQCQQVTSVDELIEKVYPNLIERFAEAHLIDDSDFSEVNVSDHLMDRVILASTNSRVREINQAILDRIPGDEYHYSSADSVIDADPTLFQPEILNSLQPSGTPPHQLSLKPNIPVILMRTLNKKAGLCNGTRLTILELHPNHLKVRIASGKFKGKIQFLFRISCISSDNRVPFQLKRVQFPILPCFAMTINKAQGQTLKHVGIDVSTPIFSHGQLYVALSRAEDPNELFLFSDSQPVHNIVFDEIIC